MLRRSTLALAAAVAVLAARPAVAEELRALNVASLRGRIRSPGEVLFTERGLELQVDGNTHLELPLQAQVLELDVEASGPMLLTWAVRTPGREFRPFGPPWRHRTLPRERTRITLDLRVAAGWTPAAQPLLGFTGAGRVVIHGLRELPVGQDLEASLAAVDRALFWAPESTGHTTINFLTTPYWSATRGIRLADVLAIAALAIAGGWVAVARLLARQRGRPRPRVEVAIALGALVALAPWDLHFLVRFLPMLHLRPTLDVEARIRENYDVAPDVGALAALARETLRPDERVGAMGPPAGWFAPQTICFDLAPRPCVIVRPGESEHQGISGVGRLRTDELDAIVGYRLDAVPAGFVPVASLGPSAFVARRQR